MLWLWWFLKMKRTVNAPCSPMTVFTLHCHFPSLLFSWLQHWVLTVLCFFYFILFLQIWWFYPVVSVVSPVSLLLVPHLPEPDVWPLVAAGTDYGVLFSSSACVCGHLVFEHICSILCGCGLAYFISPTVAPLPSTYYDDGFLTRGCVWRCHVEGF